MQALQAIRTKYLQLRGVMDERVTRLWAAAEAVSLGRGGIAAVAWMQRTETGFALPSQSLGMQIALAVMLVPASIWLAQVAFRASERWVERVAGRV